MSGPAMSWFFLGLGWPSAGHGLAWLSMACADHDHVMGKVGTKLGWPLACHRLYSHWLGWPWVVMVMDLTDLAKC
jgi:hypothetical protein